MFPTIQLGPLVINTPGIILLVGLWLGLVMSERKAFSRGVEKDIVYTLAMIMLISGFIGARVVFVLFHWQAFKGNLVNIFSLDLKLLDPWGGFAVSIIFFLRYLRKLKITIPIVLDISIPTLASLALAMSIANLASGIGFGPPSQLPWALDFFGISRHPVQLYEGITMIVILGMVSLLEKNYLRVLPDGMLFLIFIALSSFSFVYLDSLRVENAFLFGNIRTGQVLAWLLLAISLWLLGKQIKIMVNKTTGESKE